MTGVRSVGDAGETSYLVVHGVLQREEFVLCSSTVFEDLISVPALSFISVVKS